MRAAWGRNLFVLVSILSELFLALMGRNLP